MGFLLMCGLVGVAGDVSGNWRDVFNQLLLFDSVRGMHSTGVGFVRRFEDELSVVKRVGHPFNLFQSDEYNDKMATKNSYKVLIGHNRHATLGAKTEENAHPFKFADVIGAHNGTLDHFSVMDLVNHKMYGTDSEAIFATIQKLGVHETVKKLSGAWALTFYDREADTINFLRNSKRPLHYCYSHDRCTIIWASELEMLKYVLARAGKKVEQDEVTATDGTKSKEDKFYVTNPDVLYTWKIPKSVMDKFDLPTQVDAKGAEQKASSFFQNWDRGRIGGQTSTTYYPPKKHHGTSNHLSVVPSDFHQRLDTKKFRPPYKDSYGRVINKVEFTPIVNEGCAVCNEGGQVWGSFIYPLGKYIGYHTPYLCESCYNDETTYEFSKYAI